MAFGKGDEEVDISAEAANLESLQPKTGAQSVIRHGPLFRTMYDMWTSQTIQIASPVCDEFERQKFWSEFPWLQWSSTSLHNLGTQRSLTS